MIFRLFSVYGGNMCIALTVSSQLLDGCLCMLERFDHLTGEECDVVIIVSF